MSPVLKFNYHKKTKNQSDQSSLKTQWKQASVRTWNQWLFQWSKAASSTFFKVANKLPKTITLSPVLKFNYHKKTKNQSERMLNQWKIFINQTLSFLFYFILFLKALNFFTPPFSSFSRFHWTPHLHIFWGCIIFSLEILCWTLECNCLKLIHLPKTCIWQLWSVTWLLDICATTKIN